MIGKRRHMLPSAVWTPGQMQFPIKDAPALARIRAIVFRLEADFLTGATQAAIVSAQLSRLISMIDLAGKYRGSGAFFHLLRWKMLGQESGFPAGIPATNASHFQRFPTWRIPLWDKRAEEPGDDLPVANKFNGQVINVTGAPYAELDTGDNTWNTLAALSGTLRCWLELADPNDAPGADVEFGYNDLTGQTPNLDPGLYTDIFAFRETLATIDSAQIATIGMQVDGQQIIDSSFKLGEFLSEYNDDFSMGTDLEASSATVPQGGEALPEQPPVAAGTSKTITAPWVPIIGPFAGSGKKTQQVLAERNLRIDYTGTDSTLHLGWRRIHRRDDSEIVQAFRQLGRSDVTSADQVEGKTSSKKGLQGWKKGIKAYMPLRATTSRTS